jgi:hypothetical protein
MRRRHATQEYRNVRSSSATTPRFASMQESACAAFPFNVSKNPWIDVTGLPRTRSISARCLFMASMLTVGTTNAAPVPRAGQMAPKS